MPYLWNSWYCAGWSPEFSRTPIGRKLLGIPVVLFRKENGEVTALGDTCPHRFAPLHLGQLHGDILACPYHGLRFDENGACAFNPHGPEIPANLRVNSYPICERHQAVWIWMGDPDRADAESIPDYQVHTDPTFHSIFGYLHVKANYELIIDNLLDLTHAPYLHKALAQPADRREFSLEKVGDIIHSKYDTYGTAKNGIFNIIWPEGPDIVDSFTEMLWNPASNLQGLINPTGAGQLRSDGALLRTGHILTPETEFSSHYFWSLSHNVQHDDFDRLDEVLYPIQSEITRLEDGPMIESVQGRMGASDFFELKPVILATDAAAIRARLALKRMIEAEGGANPPIPISQPTAAENVSA